MNAVRCSVSYYEGKRPAAGKEKCWHSPGNVRVIPKHDKKGVHYLCMVSDVKTHIFTVTDVAVLYCGTSTLATNTDS